MEFRLAPSVPDFGENSRRSTPSTRRTSAPQASLTSSSILAQSKARASNETPRCTQDSLCPTCPVASPPLSDVSAGNAPGTTGTAHIRPDSTIFAAADDTPLRSALLVPGSQRRPTETDRCAPFDGSSIDAAVQMCATEARRGESETSPSLLELSGGSAVTTATRSGLTWLETPRLKWCILRRCWLS